MSMWLNRLIVGSLAFVPRGLVYRFASRYIAGDTLEDAVALVKDLNKKGIMATLDVLGEGISRLDEAKVAVDEYLRALDAIHHHQLDCNVSLKPSQFGMLLDRQVAGDHIGAIVRRASELNNFVRIDMEDTPLTQPTLDLYRALRQQHPGRVGTVVQAYLRRTVDDCHQLMEEGPTNLRLCKGIYIEPRHHAWKDFDIVRANYTFALEELLKGGAYVGIATHDEWLFFQADRVITQLGLEPHQFEFQMLLGVDSGLQDLILARGYRLRLYVPYGVHWYPYSMRRLRENPQIAMHIIKNLFQPG